MKLPQKLKDQEKKLDALRDEKEEMSLAKERIQKKIEDEKGKRKNWKIQKYYLDEYQRNEVKERQRIQEEIKNNKKKSEFQNIYWKIRNITCRGD